MEEIQTWSQGSFILIIPRCHALNHCKPLSNHMSMGQLTSDISLIFPLKVRLLKGS